MIPNEPVFDHDLKMQALDACKSVKRRKRDRDVELMVKLNRNPLMETLMSRSWSLTTVMLNLDTVGTIEEPEGFQPD
jgi:urease accessory protein UreE